MQDSEEMQFERLAIEIRILILSLLPAKDLVMFRLISKTYLALVEDEFIWKNLFKKDFNYHFGTLEILTNTQKINWQHQYKVARQNLPWPYPMNDRIASQLNPESIERQMGIAAHLYGMNFLDKMSLAIQDSDSRKVIKLIRNGFTLLKRNFLFACVLTCPPFILELLIAAVPDFGNSRYALDALEQACICNNKIALATLLAQNPTIDFTHLMNLALRHGDTDLVKIVMHYEPKLDSSYILSLIANKSGSFAEISNFPFWDGLDFNPPSETSHFEQPLFQAMANALSDIKEVNKVIWLISKGANPSNLCKSAPNLLVVPLLFKFFDQLNELDKIKSSGIEPILENLLKNYVDIELKDNDGSSALHYAIETLACTQLKLVLPILKKYQARFDTINNESQTPLHTFFMQNFRSVESILNPKDYEAVLSMLLSQNSLAATDKHGSTPLDFAIEDNVSVLPSLVQRKLIPVDYRDQEGNGLLHLIAMHWIPLSDIKKNRGHYPSAVGQLLTQFTALQISRVHLDMKIKELIWLGIDVEKTNTSGKTPLQVAVAGNTQVIEALLANGATFDMLSDTHDDQIITSPFTICKKFATAVEEKSSVLGVLMPSLFYKPSIKQDLINDTLKTVLGVRLIFNYLSDESKMNIKKTFLIKSILGCSNLTFDVCRDIAILAREGRAFTLDSKDILHLLEVYIDKCSNRDVDNLDYSDVLMQAISMKQDYLESINADNSHTQQNHNKN